MKTIHIDGENDGVRLDRVLRKELKALSLSEIYRSIRKGAVRVNGKRAKQSCRLKTGDVLEINIPQPAAVEQKKKVPDKVASLVHTDFFRDNFRLIYEDDDLVACNKPVGLVVHSGTKHTKHDTLIDLAVSYMKQKAGKRDFVEPVLVHRLDRDTSGVILIAKNKRTLRHLHHLIRDHAIEKQYVALCHGTPREKTGTIDLSLVRTHEKNRGMKMMVHKGGKRSLSSYRVIKARNNLSLVDITLHTGRTHQIRVHMAHLSCPVVGDVRYGDSDRDRRLFAKHPAAPRLFLHAEHLSFFHPTLKRTITLSAPVPKEFESILKQVK